MLRREDQIVFNVPNNAPTGCAVPLVVQIGTNANTISNTAVLPVATGSRNCTAMNSSLVNVEQGVMAVELRLKSRVRLLGKRNVRLRTLAPGWSVLKIGSSIARFRVEEKQ